MVATIAGRDELIGTVWGFAGCSVRKLRQAVRGRILDVAPHYLENDALSAAEYAALEAWCKKAKPKLVISDDSGH